MSTNINLHGTASISARAGEHGGTVWLELTMHGAEAEVALFFDDITVARAYAEAINAAREVLEASREEVA